MKDNVTFHGWVSSQTQKQDKVLYRVKVNELSENGNVIRNQAKVKDLADKAFGPVIIIEEEHLLPDDGSTIEF